MGGKPKLIAILGTNASGKSALGAALARAFNGEVVSADSRQVFRGLDLGSGKITPGETLGVQHHLIDICDPNDFFSMADYQRCAYRAIDGILARGATPFLVGGTGLYAASVTEGYLLSERPPDLIYREELERMSTPELYARLAKIAPDSVIDPNNRNRVMRALEKIQAGDALPPAREQRYDVLKLGVTWPRDMLKARIDERLDARMLNGMVDEVRNLLNNGATMEFLLKLGLEYRYIARYIAGEYQTEAEMAAELAAAIKKFAKRQMTWFKRDPDIHWLDMRSDPMSEASARIREFVSAGG